MDRTPKKFVKQQVGPYAWEVAPPGSRAIYPLLRVGAGTLINDDGKIEIDQRLHELDSPYAVDPSDEISVPAWGLLLPIGDLIARWNNGNLFYEPDVDLAPGVETPWDSRRHRVYLKAPLSRTERVTRQAQWDDQQHQSDADMGR